MIVLDNVARGGGRTARKKGNWGPLTLAFPTNRSIALLGPSEIQKQYLVDIVTGTRVPDQGAVLRHVRVSFPVGRLAGFDRSISVRRNIEHIARLYGADPVETVGLVRHVAGLDIKFDSLPARGEKVDLQMLGEAVAFAIPFDFYVLVSDRIRPHSQTWDFFRARQRTSGMLIPTNDPEYALDNCDMAIVISQNNLVVFEHVREALEAAADLKRCIGAGAQV